MHRTGVQKKMSRIKLLPATLDMVLLFCHNNSLFQSLRDKSDKEVAMDLSEPPSRAGLAG